MATHVLPPMPHGGGRTEVTGADAPKALLPVDAALPPPLTVHFVPKLSTVLSINLRMRKSGWEGRRKCPKVRRRENMFVGQRLSSVAGVSTVLAFWRLESLGGTYNSYVYGWEPDPAMLSGTERRDRLACECCGSCVVAHTNALAVCFVFMGHLSDSVRFEGSLGGDGIGKHAGLPSFPPPPAALMPLLPFVPSAFPFCDVFMRSSSQKTFARWSQPTREGVKRTARPERHFEQ